MNLKKLMLTLLVLVFILSISAVCASEDTTNELISSDAADDNIRC